MTDPLHIYSDVTDDGIQVRFRDKPYPIAYPKGVWKATPAQTRVALKDNLALATTMHLPIVFNVPVIIYHSALPLLEPYFVQNFLKDIPSCTEVDRTSTDEVVRKFYNTDYRFLDSAVVYPSPEPVEDPTGAIVGVSFGKDSMLTYAVAQEIGLEPEMIYVVEQSMTYERKHKTALAKQFKKEFGKELRVLQHETGKLRDYPYLGLPITELGWGLQTPEYMLDFIPFAYAYHRKYILFGNEQTASATYMDADGRWVVHPCYDQSHRWTVHIDQMSQTFSGRSVHTGSLIEPLMDMMIQRTLARRYPELAKYQMSCFTETEAGRDYHWCHSCSICAKMYLMCVGGGIDPKVIGLRENMLQRKYKQYYTLFGGKEITMTYAHTKTGRDEQLFAFYCAARRGVKAELVEDFKGSKLYQEAKDREEELHKTFTSLYDPISLPPELRDKVFSIYKEELATFEY